MGGASQKQLEANRQNAKLGGVKTEEGKAVSKFNALQHGVLRQSLTEYEEGLYPKVFDDLMEELKPVGFLEMMFVERIAMGYLRLFRVAKVEKEFMQSKLRPTVTSNPMDNLMENYGVKVIKEGYTPTINLGAITELEQTILRYETTIERSLYRVLHELQRLQAARAGEKPLAPIAVDVDISRD